MELNSSYRIVKEVARDAFFDLSTHTKYEWMSEIEIDTLEKANRTQNSQRSSITMKQFFVLRVFLCSLIQQTVPCSFFLCSFQIDASFSFHFLLHCSILSVHRIHFMSFLSFGISHRIGVFIHLHQTHSSNIHTFLFCAFYELNQFFIRILFRVQEMRIHLMPWI